MPSEKILEAKKKIVADLVADYKEAQSFAFVDARGLTVEQDTALRSEMRKNGVVYKVVKNTTLNLVFRSSVSKVWTRCSRARQLWLIPRKT